MDGENAAADVARPFGRKELLGRIAIAVALDTGQRFVRDVALPVDGGLKRSQPRLGLEGGAGQVCEAYPLGRPLQILTHRLGGSGVAEATG